MPTLASILRAFECVFVASKKVVEDGYEFQANRSLVTMFSAPNYCGECVKLVGSLLVDMVRLLIRDGFCVYGTRTQVRSTTLQRA